MTVRDLVRTCQREMRESSDLLPDRAADLLNQMASLLGNCNDEIRVADAEFAAVLLQYLDSEAKANRARIRAETSAEYQRKQEARHTKELVEEMIGALKYFLKSKSDEYAVARYQQ